MPSTNANNTTWYMLRYATDYAPRVPSSVDPAPPQFVPTEAPALFYDESRHVLELLPVQPAHELVPLPGIALDLDGEIYLVDPATLRLLERRCDGSTVPLLCEPGIISVPVGLALDRRGFLYVADLSLRRVVVLLSEDASSVAVLTNGLQEPVDVAVAPGGTIYVADRAGGRIVSFTPGFRHCGAFKPQDSAGLPATPRPISVMIDDDGSILVADANHPRLLRFGCEGAPKGDVRLATLVAPLEAKGITLDAPLALLAGPAGRPIAGASLPPFEADDAGILLSRIHRSLRLMALKLNHTFETRGILLSTVLDSRVPGTTWHKLTLDAATPPGTSLTIETASAETAEALVTELTGLQAGDDLPWASPQKNGRPISFMPELPDQLIQSPPGRFLRLRIVLGSEGEATPSLRWLKVFYPRTSYLDSLPRVYQRDPESALFLQHFLALFEKVLTGVEDRYEEFSRWLNPQAAPLEMINWLALLIDLTFDPSWPLARRRALVGEAMELYRRRGTVAGLRRYIEIYTGTTPLILEAFLSRPGQPALLGRGRSFLGCSFSLATASSSQSAQDSLNAAYAHRFTVVVYPRGPCDLEMLLPVVDRIVTVNKPAHTVHTLAAIYPEARVGVQSTVGFDFVLGGGTAPRTQLSGGTRSGSRPLAGSVLGSDTILGERRPQYARPRSEVL